MKFLSVDRRLIEVVTTSIQRIRSVVEVTNNDGIGGVGVVVKNTHLLTPDGSIRSVEVSVNDSE